MDRSPDNGWKAPPPPPPIKIFRKFLGLVIRGTVDSRKVFKR